jgi:membrane-associated protein
VLATLIPVAIHYFHGVHTAKKHEADGTTPDAEVDDLAPVDSPTGQTPTQA